MQDIPALNEILVERIKLKHQLEETYSIEIIDIDEFKGDEESLDFLEFGVTYNYEKDGALHTNVKNIFLLEKSNASRDTYLVTPNVKLSEGVRYTLGDNAPKADMVNSPDHYKKRYIREVIQSIKGLCTPEEYRGYLKGSKIKYLARYQDKGGIEDLEKGQWYGAELIAFEKEQINQKQEATQ